MKIDANTLERAKELIPRLPVDFDDLDICFPINFKVETTNEFGMKTNAYKSETYYGNSYIFVLIRSFGVTKLGYVSTSDLISFSLAEYLALTKPDREEDELSDEDKDFICQYEACLVPVEKIAVSSYDLR